MKIVIFAGGVGTRLCPLSRKNTPKQFEKIIGNKSTLEQTVERLTPHFNPSDIYIATGKRYEKVVTKQLSQIPKENFIYEPEMRDVGPAIGLASSIVAKNFPDEAIAILWSDHMVKHEDIFRKALLQAESIIEKKEADFVFLTQKPRFANVHIGWIEVGDRMKETDETRVYTFNSLHYHPELAMAEKFFANEKYVWNLGYFVTTPRYLLSQYETYLPEMYKGLMEIQENYETDNYQAAVDRIYPTFKKISFDEAILIKLAKNNINVISADIGWSDVGAWEALKEALAGKESENVTQGKVMLESSQDTLLYNYTDQLAVGIDLSELLIINTEDVLLICPKNSVPKIKKLVESLNGTPHEDLA